MAPHVTRIDPDFPVCWEDEDTLRVGFDLALTRVHRPSAGVQRLMSSLRAGVASDLIGREASRLGATPTETRGLLEALKPVLLSNQHASPPHEGSPPAVPRLRVHLFDDGRAVPGLRDALLATNVCVLAAYTPEDAPDLVLQVERFLEPLERAQQWLITSQPHLLLRFTDQSIFVGPIIAADGDPCHTCIVLTSLANDTALPVLAAQLYGTIPQSESEAGAHMAAAWVAMFMRRWRGKDRSVHTSQIVIPITAGLVSGAPRFATVAAHPECACHADSASSQSLPQR